MDAKPDLTAPQKRPSRARRTTRALSVLFGVYLVGAYMLMPTWWRYHGRRSAIDDVPTVTRTKDGAAGDPVNVALVGTRKEVMEALLAAGWDPADPITIRTSLRICKASLLRQSYRTAPVSDLFLYGRQQDLAFQLQEGGSPRQRHHVRFWRAPERTEDDRPIWVGAATYDRKVGASKRTGQITHHIDPDVDAERDRVIRDLSVQLAHVYRVRGVGPTQKGRNGGFDRYFTDGDRVVGVLSDQKDAVALVQQPAP
jgi:hypothetical protein